jgi:hypothetical protein
MAGVKARPEDCMLCAPDPCECGTTKLKRTKSTKSTKTPKDPEITHKFIGNTSKSPRGELRNKIKQAAAVAPVYTAPAPAPVRIKAHITNRGEEELFLTQALQSLNQAGLLAPEEKAKYQLALSSSMTTVETSIAWKARRKFIIGETERR